jgi:hypothetical protein
MGRGPLAAPTDARQVHVGEVVTRGGLIDDGRLRAPGMRQELGDEVPTARGETGGSCCTEAS